MPTPYDSALTYDGMGDYDSQPQSIFTPPTVGEVPPVLNDGTNPVGNRLMRYYPVRQRGVAIFKMSDGTYRSARPVPGVTVGSGGTVPVAEPYPAVPAGQVVNGALNRSWVFGVETVVPLDQPTVAVVYNGGSSYAVSASEAAALSAAGLGGFLS
jgi:hypothetical protein